MNEVRKREILTMIHEINAVERQLAEMGVDAIDEFDRMEAMEIIDRIELQLLARASIKKSA